MLLCQICNWSTLCQWFSIIVLYKWRNATPSTKIKDLNSCHDSYVKIIKMKICVIWFVHFHLCLLGCAYCLLVCWSSCHRISKGIMISKVCVTWLWPRGEHMLSSWPLGSLYLLLNMKPQGERLGVFPHVPLSSILASSNEDSLSS